MNGSTIHRVLRQIHNKSGFFIIIIIIICNIDKSLTYKLKNLNNQIKKKRLSNDKEIIILKKVL